MTVIPETSNPLQDLIDEVKAQLELWQSYQFPPLPEVPEESERVQYSLVWRQPQNTVKPKPTLSLKDARFEMGWKMYEYATERGKKKLLLVKAQPGIGKTHGAIELAQTLAAKGKRVLYLMPTHEHFNTLAAFPHFDPDKWYHWLSYKHPLPGGGEDQKMCRYHRAAERWMAKGYPLMAMCESLCPLYRAQCPYRMQKNVPNPIIAGAHEHATKGLAISKFHIVIIDEMPLRAFLQPREIPMSGIVFPDAVGPVATLQAKLLQLSANKRILKGKPLLDQIGPLLGDVYAQFEDVADLLPSVPLLATEADVDRAGYWYLSDLLPILVAEWKAWEAGQDRWLERVIVSGNGLTLLTRGNTWKHLPKRVIAIDATANAGMYRQMFNREVEVYQPAVKMRGKIHQITHRYNGITQMANGQVTDACKEALAVVKAIVDERGYSKPGVVTFMGAAPTFAQEFGLHRVAHFYGQRGSNSLSDCDALFVVGSPSPSDHHLMQTVAIINQGRIDPYVPHVLPNGGIVPLRSVALREYNCVSQEGLAAYRYISGFWHDPDLETVSSAHREDELIQALHRARPLTREVDVWLLSSVPTDEYIAEIYDDPGPAIGCPGGIPWSQWLKIREWLPGQETITYLAIAELCGVGEQWAKSQRWLDKIAAAYPGDWQITELSRTGARGPRPKGLSRVL